MFSYVKNIVQVLKGDKIYSLCSKLGNFVYLVINYCGNLKLKTPNSKQIFELNALFYIKVSVMVYQSSGPSQCFVCVRVVSQNCGYAPRCIKCARYYTTAKCQILCDAPLTCYNCCGVHTANYHSCPYFISFTKTISKPATKPIQIPINLLIKIQPFPLSSHQML